MGVKELVDQRDSSASFGLQRPSSEYDRWLRAVCSDPYDATSRLAYADWLEETTSPPSPRAELIRVQCALARVEDVQYGCDGSDERRGARHQHAGEVGEVLHGVLHETDPRKPHHHHDDRCHDPRRALRDRERELLAWATDALLPAGWVAVAEPEWLRVNVDRVCLFRRGFAEAAVMRAEDLVPLLYHETPRLNDVPPGLPLFRSEPLVAVTLAGKQPSPHVPGWGWHRAGGVAPDEPDDLPPCLWGRLLGDSGQRHDPDVGWKWYPSEAAAREALSRACVDFGREWAGLPPLSRGPLP